MSCASLGVIEERGVGLAQRLTVQGETWGAPGGRRLHEICIHHNSCWDKRLRLS